MTYDPKLLEFMRVIPGSVIGLTLVVGRSLLGEDRRDLEDVPGISSIELTDGYNIGQGGELSIDPLTGTAHFAERIRATPGTPVQAMTQQHELYTGTAWELRYSGTIVAQGRVTRVESSVTAEGPYWTKKTQYILAGVASTMLDTSVTWTGTLPEEGALTRLRRFFAVDTSPCRSIHVTYFDAVKAPSTLAGTSTLLDIARNFTAQTRFPVRTENTHASLPGLTVIPAVTFQGSPPPPLILPPAEQWTSAADFLSDALKPAFSVPAEKTQSVDVIKDFDTFIAGVGKRALETGTLGSTFRLSQSRLAWTDEAGGPLDVGVRAPVAIDFFGDIKIVAQINHAFTGPHYRSSLELATPAEVTP